MSRKLISILVVASIATVVCGILAIVLVTGFRNGTFSGQKAEQQTYAVTETSESAGPSGVQSLSGTSKGKENPDISVADGAGEGNPTVTVFPAQPPFDKTTEKWQEGLIRYKGEVYRYNPYVKTYLFMGVDKEGKVEKAKDPISGGQSDAMFLLITDDSNRKMSVIPINRNTMTEIRMLDLNGFSLGYQTAQICLAHSFGDGMKESCRNAVEAVENLFYGIPVSGFIAMNMDGIGILNSLAGGVTVEVIEDIEYGSVHLIKGDVVNLSDSEAYAYVRFRTNEFAAANQRLEREKQYAFALYDALKQKVGGDAEKAVDMYNTLSDYICTNVEFADIAEDLVDYGFEYNDLHEIEGNYFLGKNLEEFYVDESSIYDIIIKYLYVSVE